MNKLKELLKDKKVLIILGVVFLLVLILILASCGKDAFKPKPVGYVTLDISSGVALGYDENEKVIEVKNYNAKDKAVKLEDVKDLSVLDALSKILSNYNDGTIMLIGIDKSDVGKKIEDYLINDFPGVDRHVIKIVYIDNTKEIKEDISLGKEELLGKIKLDVNNYKNKSMEEILTYTRENDIDADTYLYDLEELDNFVPRYQ